LLSKQKRGDDFDDVRLSRAKLGEMLTRFKQIETIYPLISMSMSKIEEVKSEYMKFRNEIVEVVKEPHQQITLENMKN